MPNESAAYTVTMARAEDEGCLISFRNKLVQLICVTLARLDRI